MIYIYDSSYYCFTSTLFRSFSARPTKFSGLWLRWKRPNLIGGKWRGHPCFFKQILLTPFLFYMFKLISFLTFFFLGGSCNIIALASWKHCSAFFLGVPAVYSARNQAWLQVKVNHSGLLVFLDWWRETFSLFGC